MQVRVLHPLLHNMKTFFRVCNIKTEQGLWYNFDGSFSGLIHSEFNFCQNHDLAMDYDPELVGWLSAVECLEDLYTWFSKEDISKLAEYGWFVVEYETEHFKFYEKFAHYVICQKRSKIKKIYEEV